MSYFYWIPVILIIILIVPFAGIFSLNTLFGLSIPFTFKTWLAALILSSLIGGSKR